MESGVWSLVLCFVVSASFSQTAGTGISGVEPVDAEANGFGTASPCSAYWVYNNYMYGYTFYYAFWQDSVDTCCGTCSGDPSCTAWAWVGDYCYLSSEKNDSIAPYAGMVTGVSKRFAPPNATGSPPTTADMTTAVVTTGSLTTGQPGGRECAPYWTYVNYNYGGKSFYASFESDLGTCCSTCSGDPSCNAYAWDGSWCYLKSTVGGAITYLPGMTSGVSKYYPPPSITTGSGESDIPSSVTTLGSTKPDSMTAGLATAQAAVGTTNHVPAQRPTGPRSICSFICFSHLRRPTGLALFRVKLNCIATDRCLFFPIKPFRCGFFSPFARDVTDRFASVVQSRIALVNEGCGCWLFNADLVSRISHHGSRASGLSLGTFLVVVLGLVCCTVCIVVAVRRFRRRHQQPACAVQCVTGSEHVSRRRATEHAHIALPVGEKSGTVQQPSMVPFYYPGVPMPPHSHQFAPPPYTFYPSPMMPQATWPWAPAAATPAGP